MIISSLYLLMNNVQLQSYLYIRQKYISTNMWHTDHSMTQGNCKIQISQYWIYKYEQFIPNEIVNKHKWNDYSEPSLYGPSLANKDN